MALIIVGGIGYPVVHDIARTGRNPRHWTLHAELTLFATVAMIVSDVVLLTAREWGNPGTLGSMSTTERLVNGPVGFEVLSALGTVGLSTGITPGLPTGGHLLLTLLVFLGRLGPVITGKVEEYIELDDGFVLVETRCPGPCTVRRWETPACGPATGSPSCA